MRCLARADVPIGHPVGVYGPPGDRPGHAGPLSGATGDVCKPPGVSAGGSTGFPDGLAVSPDRSRPSADGSRPSPNRAGNRVFRAKTGVWDLPFTVADLPICPSAQRLRAVTPAAPSAPAAIASRCPRRRE
jgi:hypothetical protein